MKGHDLKPVGSHKQVLSCVQREPRLTGVHKLDDSLHDGRRHFLQSDLSETGLNQRAGEHGPKVRAHGCQEDSEGREGWRIEDVEDKSIHTMCRRHFSITVLSYCPHCQTNAFHIFHLFNIQRLQTTRKYGNFITNYIRFACYVIISGGIIIK